MVQQNLSDSSSLRDDFINSMHSKFSEMTTFESGGIFLDLGWYLIEADLRLR